jgi:D-arginine dehydrogenase
MTHDIIIIGGGIAGASLAYWLSEHGVRDIAILERESRLGYHSSSRSAQSFVSFSHDPFERRATSAARAFFTRPPPGFGHIYNHAGTFILFDQADWPAAREAAAHLRALGTPAEEIAPSELPALLPFEAATDVAGALHLSADGRFDADALLRGYRDQACARGARFVLDSEVTGVVVRGDTCKGVMTRHGALEARSVVNAAGAWAGRIGALAHATPIEFRPLRRTVISFAAPEGVRVRGWPLVEWESRKLYLAPEGQGLLACPMEEDLVAPGDAAPDPAVIATARARIAALAPGLAPRELTATRAGLRTFAPDRKLVIGEDPALRGFFWLAGQGGWGIESSPVIGRMAADLIVHGATEWAEAGSLSPRRFV